MKIKPTQLIELAKSGAEFILNAEDYSVPQLIEIGTHTLPGKKVILKNANKKTTVQLFEILKKSGVNIVFDFSN